MSVFNGDNIKVDIYGESHAEKIGVKCKGFPKFTFNVDKLKEFTDRRKPSKSSFSTPRKEADEAIFISGVNNGEIENGEFEAVIYNTNKKSSDYNELYARPRPSHADYCAFVKDGRLDFSGGGRFSGRLTAPLCIAGGIAKQYLESKNVRIYAYLSSVGTVNGKSYKDGVLEEELLKIDGFPSINKKEEMLTEIEKVSSEGDSVGAVIECVVYGFIKGVGDNLFSGLEGKLSYSLFGIPAVKGVEFGSGFDLAKSIGSKANDSLYFDESGEVKTKTNHSGGICGGISNGMPITLRVGVKPTPSIFIEQDTVDLIRKENVKIKIKGRHDSCVSVRAVPVVESAVALALLDSIL